MPSKSIIKNSLFVTILIQLFLTSYIFVITYLVNPDGRVYKFEYFIYVSMLALQGFPIFFIIILIFKTLIAYFRKNKGS
jgi:hypothetical protein